MNLIKSKRIGIGKCTDKKTMNLTVSTTAESCNKEKEVQGVGDDDILYERLLHDMDVETLMNEDDFEIDTGSCDGLQGVKQEDPVLKDQGKLAARKNHGPQGKQIDGRSRHEQTFVIRQREKLPSWTVATWYM